MDENMITNEEASVENKEFEDILDQATDDAFDTLIGFSDAENNIWAAIAKDQADAFFKSLVKAEERLPRLSQRNSTLLFYVFLMQFGRSFEKVNRQREKSFDSLLQDLKPKRAKDGAFDMIAAVDEIMLKKMREQETDKE